MRQLAPSILESSFGLTTLEVVAIGSLPGFVSTPASIACTAAETYFLSRGSSAVTIRRVASGLGFAVTAAATLLFVAAPTSRWALAAWFFQIVFNSAHNSGYTISYWEVREKTRSAASAWKAVHCHVSRPQYSGSSELTIRLPAPQVGGVDTALLIAIGNTISNGTGVLVPVLYVVSYDHQCTAAAPLYSRPSVQHRLTRVNFDLLHRYALFEGLAASGWRMRAMFVLTAAIQLAAAAVYSATVFTHQQQDRKLKDE